MSHDAQTHASDYEVLEHALALLEQHGISRGAYARNVFGETTGTHDQEASCFCVVGAISFSHRVLTGDPVGDLDSIFELLAPYMEPGRIVHWNDDASDAEIISVLRSAINLERTRLHLDLN